MTVRCWHGEGMIEHEWTRTGCPEKPVVRIEHSDEPVVEVPIIAILLAAGGAAAAQGRRR